ncbi:MAG: peptide chain release factor N(5)-glutamine methyltransferase [Treponema sp.]|jgi:release factor glutamine methyltransferase|nr:peptide chain release factor N(5)-glutamine methyltransferase [Treponema sp.]
MTIREALAQAYADLKFAGIDTPGLDASMLLAHVLQISRTELYSRTGRLSEKTCIQLCDLIERRCGGECTAYLTGKKEFRGLEFTVNNSVLVPRPDTETLVEAAMEILNNNLRREGAKDAQREEEKINVLDLCTGSGAVAVALKHEMPQMEVHAADISAQALDVARINAARLLPGKTIHFYQGDLFDALSSLPPFNCSFDLIISNPPYVSTNEIQALSAEVQNEPRLALDGGKSGLEIIERIVKRAAQFLQKGGWLLLEADPRQMKKIQKLLEKCAFANIKLNKDLSGQYRVIGGKFG